MLNLNKIVLLIFLFFVSLSADTNKLTKSFFAKIKIAENNIEIVDKRTSLNGLKIYSKSNLDNVKIKIVPCKQMSLKIPKNKTILGNCFKVNQKVGNARFVYPKNLFKDVKDNNFETNDNLEGGLTLYSSHYDVYIYKYDKYILSSVPYIEGFYFIGLEDKDKVKKLKGEIVGYLCGKIYKKNNQIYLNNRLLKELDGQSFKQLWEGYVKDKNGIYFINIERILGHHGGCVGIRKFIGLNKLNIVKSPKSFQIIEHQSVIPSFAKDKYHIYEINWNKGNVKIVKSLKSNFKVIKRIENIKIRGGHLGENTTLFLKNIKISELSEILKKYPKNKYKREVKYGATDYNKDENTIYYFTNKVDDADYDSFEVISYQIGEDKNAIYLRGKKLFDTNGSVEILYKGGGSRVIGKDKSFVYDLYEGKIIKNIDAKTFSYLDSYYQNYSKDKNHIYCCYERLNIIKDADVETFQILKNDNGRGYANDKNYVYYRGERMIGADVKTIKIFSPNKNLNTYHAKDKNFIYEDGEIIKKIKK